MILFCVMCSELTGRYEGQLPDLSPLTNLREIAIGGYHGGKGFNGAIPEHYLRDGMQLLYLAVNRLTGVVPPLPSSLRDFNARANDLSALPSAPLSANIRQLNVAQNNIAGWQ
jgi:hypothetical protein